MTKKTLLRRLGEILDTADQEVTEYQKKEDQLLRAGNPSGAQWWSGRAAGVGEIENKIEKLLKAAKK